MNTGDGYLSGAVRDRFQAHNAVIDRRVKHDTETGHPFKGLRRKPASSGRR